MVLLRQKVNVPGRHYSNQLAAHFARFCHGDPRETVSHFGFKYIPHSVARTHHHWVCDEALLEFLPRANSFKWDTQTSLQKNNNNNIAQTLLPWPCELHWPEIQLYSCDELFQSRPSTEKRVAKSQKPFLDLWNCHLSLWQEQQADGTRQMLRCLCESLYSLPWRWPWKTLSLYPWETKWEESSGLSSSLMQTLDPKNLYAFGKRTRQDLWP